jgi:hypothetical protein
VDFGDVGVIRRSDLENSGSMTTAVRLATLFTSFCESLSQNNRELHKSKGFHASVAV